MIKLKKIFEPASSGDGFRILIDRLWPEGLEKENANIDLWIKEVAPSVLLRTWFDLDPDKWELFERRYTEELGYNEAIMEILKEHKNHQTLTLLYAAGDQERNHAMVLQNFLNNELDN